MNSLNVIFPYQYKGQWVFDDEEKGLKKEPFVLGADILIDLVVKDSDLNDATGDPKDGFKLIFSKEKFPTWIYHLWWKNSEEGGNWYHSPEFGMDCWLCPALFKYFDTAPNQIYFKAEPL
jgi:hypothetical protein